MQVYTPLIVSLLFRHQKFRYQLWWSGTGKVYQRIAAQFTDEEYVEGNHKVSWARVKWFVREWLEGL